MHIYTLERTQVIPRPREETFAFFANAENLETITPSWLRFRIVTSRPIRMHRGTVIEYRLGWRGMPIRWRTEICAWDPPYRFVDVQLQGPYRLWEHEHSFEVVVQGTLMRDLVRYALPLGFLGRVVHRFVLSRDLKAIFDFRARKVAALLGSECSHT